MASLCLPPLPVLSATPSTDATLSRLYSVCELGEYHSLSPSETKVVTSRSHPVAIGQVHNHLCSSDQHHQRGHQWHQSRLLKVFSPFTQRPQSRLVFIASAVGSGPSGHNSPHPPGTVPQPHEDTGSIGFHGTHHGPGGSSILQTLRRSASRQCSNPQSILDASRCTGVSASQGHEEEEEPVSAATGGRREAAKTG